MRIVIILGLNQIADTNFAPVGRTVVVPDIMGKGGWTTEKVSPFVCAFETVGQRIQEFGFFFFEASRDKLFVFESGELILIDHDNRIFWAKSLQAA